MRKNLVMIPFSLMFLVLVTCDVAFADELFEGPILCSQSGAGRLTVGDFNNDKKMDVASLYSYVVSVSLGNGDGTCRPGVSFSSITPSGYYAQDIVSGDFNGDGNDDIVTLDPFGSAIIFLGNGDGSFQEKRTYPVGNYPQRITVGDFNGDGNLDIATANYYGYRITVLIGNGDGTFWERRDFGKYIPRSDYGGGDPWAITTGDFNADGYVDLATANIMSGTVSVFLGNGDGVFEDKGEYITGTYPRDIAVGDFNGDGKMDLATSISHYAYGTISVLLGNGDGTFQTNHILRSGWGAFGIAVADFDNNGTVDLVATNTSGAGIEGNTVSVFLGNGDATFQPPRNYSSYGGSPGKVIATDFNGDGSIDVVIGNGYGYTPNIGILLNISNQPPVANAGTDQLVECTGPSGASVTLDGSGSTDPDGDAITYKWTWNGGTADGVNPTISLPLGTTEVTLTVSDGKTTAIDKVSIIVKDTVPPVTTATGGNGNWYNTNVIATFSASDSCSGVKEIHYSMNGIETVVSGNYASATITTEGIHNITYYSVDNAGIQESPKSITVKIDKAAPTITGTAMTAPNASDWYNTDVLVHFIAYDSLSGIDTTTPDIIISAEGANQSVVGTAFDKAGNSASKVVAGINIDKSAPIISITSPMAGKYVQSEIVDIQFASADDLSGVYKNTVYLDGQLYDPTKPMNLLNLSLGTHTLKVESTNYAGLMGTSAVTFAVIIDSNSMIDIVKRLYQMGAIYNEGIMTSLVQKLEAVQSNQNGTAINILNAFISSLNPQQMSGVAIEILKTDATYIIGHL